MLKYFYMQTHDTRKRTGGFTIVEMLVVIVVIAILAAITIVSFNGVQQQARESMLKAELAKAQKQIQLYISDTGKLPTAINSCPTPTAGKTCYVPSAGVSMTYYADSTQTPPLYYINATTGTTTLRLSSVDSEAVKTVGKTVVFTDATERTGPNEFLKYVDLAPTIDAKGLVPYVISFDIKSANTATKNTATVYQQNGSGAKYSFSASVPVTTSYVRQSVTVTPTLWNNTLTESWLAFYGTYSTGNVLSVKNVVVELAN
jgi:prepilin-type N-terminal cleavage/methylation domain-containing protein